MRELLLKGDNKNYEISLIADNLRFRGSGHSGRDPEITVDVPFVDINNIGGDAATWVGPGTVTVTQTKVATREIDSILQPGQRKQFSPKSMPQQP